MGRKLSDKSGAALVLALMFFLLCACVGVMVVTAASANAGKAAKMREEEQAYLAVKAAANSFAELMRESTVTVGYTEEETVTVTPGPIAPDGTMGTPKTETVCGALKSSFTNIFAPGSQMEALFGEDIRNLYLRKATLSSGVPVLHRVMGGPGGTPGLSADIAPDSDAIKYEYNLELEVEGSPQVPAVLVTLKINKGDSGTDNNLYEATITARTASGSHMVTLYSGATCNESSSKTSNTVVTDGGKTITTTTTVNKMDISWKNWEVERGVI